MSAKVRCVIAVLLLAEVSAARAQSQEAMSSANATAAADYKRIIVETLLRRMRTGEQPVVKGTALVRFTIERSGLVTASNLAGSSGNADLDMIALGVVPAGLKLPPFPPQMVRTNWTITTPLRFSGTPRQPPDCAQRFVAMWTNNRDEAFEHLPKEPCLLHSETGNYTCDQGGCRRDLH